jgi:hypothetical protein
MKKVLFYVLCFVILSSFSLALMADGTPDQKGRITLSGYVRDAGTGEDLIGASVYVSELKTGVSTNVYGFYSLSLLPGKYTFIYSYIGYEPHEKVFELRENITFNVELTMADQQLEEVVITGTALNENVTRTEMSSINLDIKTIRKIPAFMGEIDLIKAIHLLPGVQVISEGSSGFSVRGGGLDQNLILLDEATVYNASHLMGFFSVFNNDAIKDVKLHKGDIPASSGGRLASLVDIRMKDGNNKQFSATGGIGTISSRLTLEGPVEKNRGSFILSGRRTYADLFLKLSNDGNLRNNKLYFYDLNGKINWMANENNRFYLSAYYGDDIFKNDFFKIGWGNRTFTFRWNHLFSQKMFTNTTLVYSEFNYQLGVPEGSANSFDWVAQMKDYGIKGDLTYYLNTNNTIRYGISLIYHRFNPGIARGIGENSFLTEYEVQSSNALESGLYVSNEQSIGARLTLKYGLRYSHFVNVGPSTIYNYSGDYTKIDSSVYGSGVFFSPYHGLEPRIGATYLLNEVSSVKASYSRTRQYIHLAQNSTAGTPLDVWFPSSPNVKPQIADQIALGYFRNFNKNRVEASAEAYYKYGRNAIDFKDHADLLLNKEYEGELRFGETRAYGIEFLVYYTIEKVSGWVSYTLSRTEKKIEQINGNKLYPAGYDKTHDVSVVVSYELSERLVLGATWVYNTGSAVTFPVGKYHFGGLAVPIFSDRNSYRMPDYHRLDLSVSLFRRQKPDMKFNYEWNLSVYNAYGRKNPWVINFVQDKDNPEITKAEMTYLFSVVPAITFNFKF